MSFSPATFPPQMFSGVTSCMRFLFQVGISPRLVVLIVIPNTLLNMFDTPHKTYLWAWYTFGPNRKVTSERSSQLTSFFQSPRKVEMLTLIQGAFSFSGSVGGGGMAGSDVVSPDGSVVLCVCQCVCVTIEYTCQGELPSLPEPIESFPI